MEKIEMASDRTYTKGKERKVDKNNNRMVSER